MRVVLADYGAGNLRSVCSAFARAGAAARGKQPVSPVSPLPTNYTRVSRVAPPGKARLRRSNPSL
jgi:imidazoleglycerol phosphate synthase glutamine amidotransferase subunit HisH